jgi:hypothetical protein
MNYERKGEGWRTRIFNFVSTLVKLGKECPALAVDNTNFIHVDTSCGGKIMAWSRGSPGMAPVVVVANFTDEDTPGNEYHIDKWPDRERRLGRSHKAEVLLETGLDE